MHGFSALASRSRLRPRASFVTILGVRPIVMIKARPQPIGERVVPRGFALAAQRYQGPQTKYVLQKGVTHISV